MENARSAVSPARANRVLLTAGGGRVTRVPTNPPRTAGDEAPSVRALGSADVAALEALVDTGSERRRVELIDGILYELPMTSFEHGHIASVLVATLIPAYQLGRGGPGGWWIQGENDFCADGHEVFRPDVVGWRRERLEGIDRARRVEVVPDWVCEVLSPSTRRHDLEVKVRAYARVGVQHGWYVDPLRRELTCYELCDGKWNVVHVHGGGARVNVEPFDAVPIEPATLWAGEPSG